MAAGLSDGFSLSWRTIENNCGEGVQTMAWLIFGEKPQFKSKNRGQASKPEMCSKQAAEKWHPLLLSFFTKVFSTWLSVYIGVRYWLHPRIDMKKTLKKRKKKSVLSSDSELSVEGRPCERGLHFSHIWNSVKAGNDNADTLQFWMCPMSNPLSYTTARLLCIVYESLVTLFTTYCVTPPLLITTWGL